MRPCRILHWFTSLLDCLAQTWEKILQRNTFSFQTVSLLVKPAWIGLPRLAALAIGERCIPRKTHWWQFNKRFLLHFMTEKYAMFIHKLWHTQVDQIEWFGGQTRDSRLWSSTSHLLETLPTLPSKINRPQNNPTSTLNGKMSHSNGTKDWKIGRSSPIASIFGVGWSFWKIPHDTIWGWVKTLSPWWTSK